MSADHKETANVQAKRVAIVISNPTTETTTMQTAGFWWSELTHPYYEFIQAGYEVEIFSNDGGECVADATSDPRDQSGYAANDLITKGFIATERLFKLVQNTRKVNEIETEKFDAIFVAGGQGPMYTYETAKDLQNKVVDFFETGKVVATICHGAAILKFARLADGKYLTEGRNVGGFSNAEEDFIDNVMWQNGYLPAGQSFTPWRIEDTMKSTGANYLEGGLWKPFAVRDGKLVTGQQNFSGAVTAQKVIEVIS